MSRTRVWLDCDPGHDDALALVLAASHAHLLGVSCSPGNQTLEKTTRNALRVLRAVGRPDVPVVSGAARPLVSAPRFCPEIHGASGLDVLDTSAAHYVRFLALADGSEAQPRNGIVAMREGIMGADGGVALVATGSLTNVALLLRVFPEVAERLEKIVWMGGATPMALGPAGNVEPCAEFNALLDSEAVHIVLSNGRVPVFMVPLQVTHSAIVTPALLERLPVSPWGRLVHDWMLFFADTYDKVFGFRHGPPLHDPVAVALALRPDLFECRHLNVEVELHSPLSRGQTVCDVYGTTGRAKNCHVAVSANLAAFWDLLVEAVRAADTVSPLNQ